MLGRKVFHILAGSAVALGGLVIRPDLYVPSLALFTLAFLGFELARMRSSWLRNHPLFSFVSLKERERRGLTGASYLLFAALTVFLFFDPKVAVLSLLYLTIGDPAAAFVGSRLGRRKLWGKSLEGTAALISVNLILAFSFSHFLGINLIAAVCAVLVAAIIEGLPLPLDDNLAIPPAAALTMTLLPYLWS